MKMKVFLISAVGVFGLLLLIWLKADRNQSLSSLNMGGTPATSDLKSMQTLNYGSGASVSRASILKNVGGPSPRQERRVAASKLPNSSAKVDDVKTMLSEKSNGYAWSKTIRAVFESKVKVGEKKVSSLAGFYLVIRNEKDVEGLYVVASPNHPEPGVYSGELLAISKSKDFEKYLIKKSVKFNHIGDSFFIEMGSIAEAIKFLVLVRQERADAVIDLDVLYHVNEAL